MANRSATKILKSTSSFVAMLTAGVLMAPTASFAIDAGALPENGTVVGGSANLDYSQPNKLDVHQNTDRVVIDWDSFNIGNDATTQFYQPGSKSLAVNRVYSKGSDPTQILGKLIANGKVMVLDRNGVIFGKDAVVDVGGIIASTGDINVDQVMSGADKINLNNFGSGSIINNGLINAADSGLVALVGPNAVNNGVINAKVGKVALAAGEKATVDLYGDGLVEIAADSNLEKALVSNNGTINAQGGTVQMTAQAAKDAVDNVINMDGVIDVSSVTVEGGKIILGGNGTTTVTGKMKSSNGKIDIKSKNINVADTAVITNNGDDAKVDIIADNHTDFRGTIRAIGGDVEVSGKETLGFTGLVEADTLLLDPKFAIIHSGILNNPLGLGYVFSAQALANSMETGTAITVQADDFIDVGTRTGLYSTGNTLYDIVINAIAGTLGGGDIDLSKFNYTQLEKTGSFFGLPIFGLVNHNGTTLGSLRLLSDTVNINKNLIMGNGSVRVDANTLNLNGKIYDKDKTTLLGDSRLIGAAQLGTINVGAKGVVQQGINFADDATALTTVNVAGTHKENITIAKNNIKLTGLAGAKLEAANSSSLVKVTGDNVTIDPFVFDGLGIASNGIDAVGADNLIVDGNTFLNFTNNGIRVENSPNSKITGNTVYNTGSHGIYLLNSAGSEISTNNVGTAGLANNINGDGIKVEKSDNTLVNANVVSKTKSSSPNIGSGINIVSSNGSTVTNNIVGTTGWNGIRFDASKGLIQNNTVSNSGQQGIYSQFGTTVTVDNNVVNGTGAEGIMILNSTPGPGGGLVTVSNNTVDNAKTDGIRVQVVNGSQVTGNKVGTLGGANNIGRDGIRLAGTSSATVSGNTVNNAARNGIYVTSGGSVVTGNAISGNTVDKTGEVGIYLNGSNNTTVSSNKVGTLGGANNIGTDGIKVEGSQGSTINGNTVSNTKSSSPNIGSGINVIGDLASTITNNIVGTTGWNGIRFDASKGLIQNNTVSNSGQQGIYSQFGTTVTVDNNVVNGTGAEGIMILNSTPGPGGGLVTVSNNTVDNAKTDGIRVQVVNGSQVTGNKVGTLGGANNIGRDGIRLAGTSSANVANNTVNNTVRHGIYVTSGAGLVTGNTVTGNTVDTTGGSGIFLNGSNNTTVSSNNVGTLGGANNIGNDGVRVENSEGSTITGNTISNTKLAAPTVGSGINVIGDFSSEVTGNIISSTGLNGIRFDAAKGVIQNNTITNAGTQGIYSQFGTILTVDNNVVNGAGNEGIMVLNSTPGPGGGIMTVSNNTVDNTATDGIRIQVVNGSQVTGNQVGTLGGANNIGRDGIRFAGTSNGTISGNTVNNTVRHGIFVSQGAGLVTGNTITGNVVDLTGDAGIFLNGSDNTTVSLNSVGLSGPGSIGSDAISVANSNLAQIVNNLVANAAKSGVKISNQGKTATVSGNNVSDSDTGMNFESGLIDLTGASNTINNVRVGYHFEPTGLNSVNLVNDTIGTTVFNNASDFYVELANGALFNPGTPTLIDGTFSSYDGFIPDSVGNNLTQPQYDAIEDKIFHYNDDNSLGLFFFGNPPILPLIEQSDLFRDIQGIPGVAGRFSITITGLPRVFAGQQTNFAANAGGGNAAGFALANNSAANLNNIATAAGDDSEGTDVASAEPQNVEPAAGGNAIGNVNGNPVQAANWGAAIDAASRGQAVTFSFSGDSADLMKTTGI